MFIGEGERMHASLVTVVAGVIACSSSMLEAVRLAQRWAKARDPIVLTGPTGSGKSHLARAIHEWSGRAGPLVELSAAELQDGLGYAQAFGHEKGAFTDADRRRLGMVAEAGAGSVFLDDAAELAPRMQSMLLRVLDTGRYRPLGASRDLTFGARLIVGTQGDLDELVRVRVIRRDLRYRLGFFTLTLPPLCERPQDVVPLAEHFLRQCAVQAGAESALGLAADVVPVLQLAPWPGNVRELRAAVRLADWNARADGAPAVHVGHLPPHVLRGVRYERGGDRAAQDRLIEAALAQSGGQQRGAAELLGVHRNTVSARVRELARHRAGGVHRNGDIAVHEAEVSMSGQYSNGANDLHR